jgi:plasmid maintenance system antidote protein VapI
MPTATTATPLVSAEALGDLRAEIARHGLKRYELAFAIGVHPTVLSAMMHGGRAMPLDVAQKLRREIKARTTA